VTKEDEILQCLRDHRAETSAKLEEHGRLLARLEERSENQTRETQRAERAAHHRMDRMERRAAGVGAVSGALTGLGVVLARIFGWPGGGA